MEIAVLVFVIAAIFITMLPMLAMLRAGLDGPFGPLLHLISGPDGQPVEAAYFWLTGGLGRAGRFRYRQSARLGWRIWRPGTARRAGSPDLAELSPTQVFLQSIARCELKTTSKH